MSASEIEAAQYQAMLRYFDIREHDGWRGSFTTQQSPFATIANGARVEKIVSEDGDAHPIGAMGTIIGSVGAPDVGIAYFIEFDSTPKEATLLVERKVAAIAAERKAQSAECRFAR